MKTFVLLTLGSHHRPKTSNAHGGHVFPPPTPSSLTRAAHWDGVSSSPTPDAANSPLRRGWVTAFSCRVPRRGGATGEHHANH